jgi:SAM-dependent methyltransferase
MTPSLSDAFLGERFDVHQRYSPVALILSELMKLPRAQILDIGSGAGDFLARRLAQAEITCLDLEIPDEFRGRAEYVEGDARDLAFPDGSFDAVVAIDVLEHVPSSDRMKVLEEACRVSRGPVIFAFPDADQNVSMIEAVMNGVYMGVHREDHRWLQEHLQHEGPSGKEVAESLRVAGYYVNAYPSGFLPWWVQMMNLEFVFKGHPDLSQWLDALHYFYNSLIAPYDMRAPAYRTVLLATRDEANVDLTVHDTEKGDLHFSMIQAWADSASQAIQRTSAGALHKVSKQLEELARRFTAYESRALPMLTEFDNAIRDSATVVSDVLVALNEAQTERLETETRLLDERGRDIARLQKELDRAQRQTTRLEQQLRDVRDSEALKIGLVLTWPMRAIGRLVRRLRS